MRLRRFIINKGRVMYKIEKKEFGYKLTFGGLIRGNEMKAWVADSKKELADAPESFGVFVDMRTLKPIPVDAQVQMQEGQQLYKQKGMIRSVVIVGNEVTKMQFKRIARRTGIDEWERYIDAETNPVWKKTGLEWIEQGIDPDQ